jgi:predicted small lipoprotein YifL
MLRPYPILIRAIGLAAILGCAALTAACGQKGALYRSDEKAQQVEPSSPGSPSGRKKSIPVFPAPQSQKQDRAIESAPQADPPSVVSPGTDSPVVPPAVDPDRPATVPPGQSSAEH